MHFVVWLIFWGTEKIEEKWEMENFYELLTIQLCFQKTYFFYNKK